MRCEVDEVVVGSRAYRIYQCACLQNLWISCWCFSPHGLAIDPAKAILGRYGYSRLAVSIAEMEEDGLQADLWSLALHSYMNAWESQLL